MNKFSLKIQIILLTVFSLILLSLVTTYIANEKTKEALIQKNYSALTGARNIKKYFIEAFFNERISDIKILSKSQDIKNIVNDMNLAYNDLKIKKK